MSDRYAKMTTEDEVRILNEIVDEELTSNLLSIGNVYPEVREYFNNEILSRWEKEQSLPPEDEENEREDLEA